METEVVLVYASAALTSLAAVAAVIVGRKAKPVASALAVIAGLLPWIYFGIEWLRPPSIVVGFFLTGLLGSAPLFLIASLLFGFRNEARQRRDAAAVSLVAMFMGIGYSISLCRLLSRME